MSRRNKLGKFAELATFANVYQCFDMGNSVLVSNALPSVDIRGKWRSEHFKNDNPIVVELACGRGEYTNALASRYPEKNFIGIDIKGARVHKGARIALEKNLNNVAYLRARIEVINKFFNDGEIDEIWITFPDPFLKATKSNRRLTSFHFLEVYHKICKSGAIIHLKTDDDVLYEFSKESIDEYPHTSIIVDEKDIYSKVLVQQDLDIKTYYELDHLKNGRTIKYLQVQLD